MPRTYTKKSLRKIDKYYQFVEWYALPDHLKEPKTQGEFAVSIGIAPETISDYKKTDTFWEDVEKCLKRWMKDKTPNVVAALYQGILKGKKAAEVKMWLQYGTGWIEKMQTEDKNLGEIIKLQNSIRELVESKRKKK